MKAFLGLTFLLLSLNNAVIASEIQTIEGDEAYQTYLKLPGVACQEYKLDTYVVMSKYQTKNCNISQTDASKWNCTVQFSLKAGKKAEVLSADCSREK